MINRKKTHPNQAAILVINLKIFKKPWNYTETQSEIGTVKCQALWIAQLSDNLFYKKIIYLNVLAIHIMCAKKWEHTCSFSIFVGALVAAILYPSTARSKKKNEKEREIITQEALQQWKPGTMERKLTEHNEMPRMDDYEMIKKIKRGHYNLKKLPKKEEGYRN